MSGLRLIRLALLAGLAYLGFYFYGLVMGVFSPVQMVGFSAIALGIVIAVSIYAFHLSRKPRDPLEEARLTHDLHTQQSRRGF